MLRRRTELIAGVQTHQSDTPPVVTVIIHKLLGHCVRRGPVDLQSKA